MTTPLEHSGLDPNKHLDFAQFMKLCIGCAAPFLIVALGFIALKLLIHRRSNNTVLMEGDRSLLDQLINESSQLKEEKQKELDIKAENKKKLENLTAQLKKEDEERVKE
jgi:hypothetical protein